jgi:hypothetical protein
VTVNDSAVQGRQRANGIWLEHRLIQRGQFIGRGFACSDGLDFFARLVRSAP